MDPQTRQLGWIQRNRTRRPTSQAVGDILEAELARLTRGPAWRRQVMNVLAGPECRELAERVSVENLRGGVLRLGVLEPAELYGLRLAWERRLVALLRERAPGAGVTTVRFVVAQR